MTKPTYSLKEISKWAGGEKFDLPPVQRGFVWKPYQIEDLWDSLLRGYPIGCFVLSKSFNRDTEKYLILDGQQRATSIALGFAETTFKGHHEKIKLFIDLDFEKSEKDTKRYLFRVITKSQPWGYQKKDNSSTLDAEKIRKALLAFKVNNYLDEPLEKFYPFDSALPVPFHLLLHAVNENDAIDRIKQWDLYKKVKSHFLQQQQEPFQISQFDDYLNKRVAKILPTIKSMLVNYHEIPALELKMLNFINNYNDVEISTPPLEHINEQNQTDEIENLFVRLNNSGTQLRGEELNYSILKANIDPDLQTRIEKACEYFIRPSRFIAILFRVYSNEGINLVARNLSLKIKPKVFQRAIASEKLKFSNYIDEVLKKSNYDGKTLIEYTKHVLAYQPEVNDFGFPYIVYSRIAEVAPEIMLAILYRLKVKDDRFVLNSELHRKMLGTISLLYLTGKGERVRDYTKLLYNIWPSVSLVNNEVEFWSSSTINRARLNDVMSSFPKFNMLVRFFNKRINKSFSNRNPFELQKNEQESKTFLDNTLYNNDLVAYAQRDFLHQQFLPLHYNLEDTNVPFDWDHISPQNAIAIKYKSRPIDEAYRTIGNMRAWPFSSNRSDRAITPLLKFNPLIDLPSVEAKLVLNDFEGMLKEKLVNETELKNKLLERSFCDKEWENLNDEKLRGRNNWNPVFKVIMKRNSNLFRHWYDELLIDKLHPNPASFEFQKLFRSGYWHINPKDNKLLLKCFANFLDVNYYVSKPVQSGIFLYFGYWDDEELSEDGFSFGVIETNTEGIISKLKIPVTKQDKYEIDTDNLYSEIRKEFTLISTETSSYKILLKEISIWIKNFPDKTIKNVIIEYFNKSLKKEYKDYFTQIINSEK